MTEQSIQSAIIKFMKAEGWHTIKLVVASPSGSPDLLCFKNKKTLCIEVKSKTGRTTPLQDHMLSILDKHTTAAFVARSVKEVKEELNARGLT